MKNIEKITALIMTFVLMFTLSACGGTETPSPSPTPHTNKVQMPDGSTFTVEFFDVGNADAALIECDGNYMLIDGGDKVDSQKMYAILKEKEIPHLEYVVATNTSAEHTGGLAGALNYATAGMTFCPADSEDTDAFNDFKKYADKNGGGITVPKAGNKYKLGNAEIEFIAVNCTPDIDSSLILKVVYGNTSFVFAGNHHIVAEQIAVNGKSELKSTLLKVADNGGDNTTSTEFLREVNPEYAVISTSGKDGCPGKTTVSILEISGVELFRTDLHGDISCSSDGNELTFSTEKEADKDKLFVAGAAEKSAETTKPEITTTPQPTEKPMATPPPAPTAKPEEKPVSPYGIDELYEANLMTTLVQAYGSVKTVSDYMGATHVMGSFLVDGKPAYLNTHIYPDGVCSYNGWYNGYSFNDYGLRPAINVFVEKLEGDPVSPNQTDLAYYFVNKDAVEYVGKAEEELFYKVTKDNVVYNLTVDLMSRAVKKVEYYDSDELTVIEYIYGEWVEGQDILDAWQNGTGYKMVTVYADIHEGTDHKSYIMPIYLPEFWEVEVLSSTHNLGVYMDSNYTQYYQYPGDGVSYELYVTNAVG